ncbi:MAG: hypothetical protein IOC82_02040 [Aestuariivirga sp.]|uniref:hypothetical protein n=1 Tax=Aestuariivirga sp. TaxID=2650926 RepID=UPI0025BF3735|nr:hypothetical protein [Aestuariivirga sp.]MCA3559794.1 hypothetical protein [Aestuariivirga sp.]
MEQDKNPCEDRETRAVLAHASAPQLAPGAMDRLMARIATEPQQAEVIPFAPRPRATFWRYAAAAPLAASLALGVWLGANGKMDFVMPSAVTGGLALNDEAPVDDLGGVGDAYAEEGLT